MTDTYKICPIKSCPFCMSDEVNVIFQDGNNYAVTCYNCGSRGPAYGQFSTEEKIIEKWNNLIIGRNTNMVKTNLHYLCRDTDKSMEQYFKDIANRINDRILELTENHEKYK